MTTDELIALTEALVGDLDLAAARKGNGVAKNLDDATYILLVRFLSGERPTDSEVQWTFPPPLADKHVVGQSSIDFDDDDEPGGPIDFDGVTLF